MISIPLFKRYIFWPLLAAILCMLISACGNSEESSGESSDTGAITFKKMAWVNPAYPNENRQSPGGNVCEDYDIEAVHITIEVPDGLGGYTVDKSVSRPCSDRKATFKEVPAKSGIRLTVVGIVAGNNDWRYENNEIAVPKNGTADLGELVMVYAGDDTTPPEAKYQGPSEFIPIGSAIQFVFEKKLVAASVDSRSCIIRNLNDGTIVNSVVDYDYYEDTGTSEILITPIQELLEGTQYEVKLFGQCATDPPSCCQENGRCIEDKHALILSEDAIYTFIARKPDLLVWGQGRWGENTWR